MRRIPIYVYSPDPIYQAGVSAQLRGRPEVSIVENSPDAAEVALVCLERIDEDTARTTRAIQRNGCPRTVLVLGEVGEFDVLLAVEIGVSGVLRRANATPERLAEAAVIAAQGEASIPHDLLATLLRQIKEAQDSAGSDGLLNHGGLTHRETDVLKLVAEGQDTKQIAGELCYSERTIKNTIQDVTRRFGLRNRSHAVAYALRHGFI